MKKVQRQYWLYVIKFKKWEFAMLLFDIAFIFLLLLALKKIIPALEKANLLNWGTILALLTVPKAIYSIYKFIRSLKKFINHVDIDVENSIETRHIVKELLVGPKEQEHGFGKLIFNDVTYEALVSESFNKKLVNESFDPDLATDNSKKRRVRNSIKENQAIKLTYLASLVRNSISKGTNFFNEKKLCLAEDPFVSTSALHIYKSTYFDSVLTNEMVAKRITSHKFSDELIFDGENEFPVDRPSPYTLKSIADSILNNHIGISTIAFTSDNYLVLWRQVKTAMVGGDKLVSTGSGSCNGSDLDKRSFKRTIKGAMIRELTEECSIRMNRRKQRAHYNSLIKNTLIIGYFRWIERGGKPEFVGITRLDIPLAKLIPDSTEVYTHKKTKTQLYFKSLDELEKHCIDLMTEPNEIVGMSLRVNLACLIHLIQNNPALLKGFLKVNVNALEAETI